MLAGFLGVISFVLGLLVVGAFMESDMRKAGLYALALAGCVGITLATTSPKPFGHETSCYVDWDGRANSTVCE